MVKGFPDKTGKLQVRSLLEQTFYLGYDKVAVDTGKSPMFSGGGSQIFDLRVIAAHDLLNFKAICDTATLGEGNEFLPLVNLPVVVGQCDAASRGSKRPVIRIQTGIEIRRIEVKVCRPMPMTIGALKNAIILENLSLAPVPLNQRNELP